MTERAAAPESFEAGLRQKQSANDRGLLRRLAAATPGDPALVWVVAAALLFALVYVAMAWTPSHYGYAEQVLGVANAGPIFGAAREIRSDDWAVLTPYFQIAVSNALGPVDLHSPYHEPLKAFFALPTHDWSITFKPDLWGFLFLDPAHAFSLHFATLAAAMIVGFWLLGTQLGCTPRFALALSMLLFFSQFVQVWWSSNAPDFAWSAWPAVAYLWNARWHLRAPAIAYATAVLMFGELYPPFIVASAFAFGFLVVAFRPNALRLWRLGVGLVGAAAAAALAWFYFADLIPVMEHTVYPGHRINNGGGVAPLMLLAHLFPYTAIAFFEPIAQQAGNACEVAVVGSYLPLALAVFADWPKLVAWMRAHLRGMITVFVGLIVLTAWCCAPIPGQFAPGFNLVPGYRMVWGLGLLLFLSAGVLASQATWMLTPPRVAVFIGIVVGELVVVKLLIARASIASALFDTLVVWLLLWLLSRRRVWTVLQPPRRLLMASFLGAAVLTFGQFNPVQPAGPIFAPQKSALLDSARAYGRANPRGAWAVMPETYYGATLNGAGVPAINHVLLRPRLDQLRRFFPTLDAATSNLLFNRYEYVDPELRWAPALPQDDGVAVPIDPFAAPLQISVRSERPTASAGAQLLSLSVTRLAPDRWGLVLSGEAPWRGLSSRQTLDVWLDPAIGRIATASGFRLPSPELFKTSDAQVFAGGFGVRLEVQSALDLTCISPQALRVSKGDS